MIPRTTSPLWLAPFVLSLVAFVPVACGGNDEDGEDSGSGGSGTGGGLNVGGDTSGSGGSDCGGVEVEAEPARVNVLLVIDKSGSMNDTPSGFDDTKWVTMVGALDTALTEIEDELSFGLKLYPDGDTEEDVCAVESDVTVGVSDSSLEAIRDSLEDVGTPVGQTPTAAALASALSYFTTGAGADLEGTNYVLLATDGGPNCNPDQDSCVAEGCNPFEAGECDEEAATCTLNLEDRCGDVDCPSGSVCTEPEQCLDDEGTLDRVAALDEVGIKTIVLGMPGSEAYTDVLDALAVAGKLPAASSSPRYHKVTDAEGLTDALRDITRTVIRSCEILLEEEPPALDRVNLFLDGEVVPKNDESGWKYDTSTSPPTIVLTGEVCAAVETEGVSRISVEFGCPTIVTR